ncbi:MAG: CPBP family intramembrane glutamic endopeptidase, partial [Acidimicrobiia bacterium]|nr:CPBP family intramembrane glutamic endopeptidase [Acidimicrobiia bacterium]
MSKSWSVRDFVIIWLSGIVGGAIAGVAGLLISSDWSLILGVAGALGFQLIALWALRRSKDDPDLGFILQFRDLPYLVLGAGLQLGMAILLAPLAEVLIPEGDSVQQLPAEILNQDTAFFVRASIAAIVVLVGPVVEELAYRGVLIAALRHRGDRYVILISAAVFSLVHIVTLTPPLLASAILVLPMFFVLGIILARMALRSGRLGP